MGGLSRKLSRNRPQKSSLNCSTIKYSRRDFASLSFDEGLIGAAQRGAPKQLLTVAPGQESNRLVRRTDRPSDLRADGRLRDRTSSRTSGNWPRRMICSSIALPIASLRVATFSLARACEKYSFDRALGDLERFGNAPRGVAVRREHQAPLLLRT
jgi:hypothetical protein